VSFDESQRSRDIFQRSTFGRNTPNQFDQCSRSHRCGEYNKAQIKAFRPSLMRLANNHGLTTPPMPVPMAKKKAIRENSDLEREKPAGSERNMVGNIEALRQNASPVWASIVPALTTFRLLGPTAQPCGERLLRSGSARLGLSQKGGLPVARRSEKEDGGSRPSTRARGGQQPSCPSLGSRAGQWVGLHRRAF
jgi:hypothetical protein